MGERGFTRSFPHELEREILGSLGQNDLTRTALVCRRFRDTSVALLFRHIARWSVHVDDDGDAVYSPLPTSFEAVFRVLEDVTLGRHVRFLDVTIALLFETAGADLACARPLTTETLHTVWKSMPVLIALSLKGPTPTGQNLGLQDITFPHLQRLRLDEPDSCIEFIMRHLHRLQNLRLPFDTDTEVTLPVGDSDVSVAALVHYQGLFLAFMPLLHADSNAHSLVSCTMIGEVGSGIVPTLAPLARHESLRHLTIYIALRTNQTTMLALLRDCPTCASVRSLILGYADGENNLVDANANPPWNRLMRSFPNAVNILPYVESWPDEVLLERGSAWAKAIAETCKDAMAIGFSPEVGFTRASTGSDSQWESNEDAVKTIYDELDVFVVYAVPR